MKRGRKLIESEIRIILEWCDINAETNWDKKKDDDDDGWKTFSHGNLIIAIILRRSSNSLMLKPNGIFGYKEFGICAHICSVCFICMSSISNANVVTIPFHCSWSFIDVLRFHLASFTRFVPFGGSAVMVRIRIRFRLSVVTRTIFKLPVCSRASDLKWDEAEKRARIEAQTNLERNAHVYINCFFSPSVCDHNLVIVAHTLLSFHSRLSKIAMF